MEPKTLAWKAVPLLLALLLVGGLLTGTAWSASIGGLITVTSQLVNTEDVPSVDDFKGNIQPVAPTVTSVNSMLTTPTTADANSGPTEDPDPVVDPSPSPSGGPTGQGGGGPSKETTPTSKSSGSSSQRTPILSEPWKSPGASSSASKSKSAASNPSNGAIKAQPWMTMVGPPPPGMDPAMAGVETEVAGVVPDAPFPSDAEAASSASGAPKESQGTPSIPLLVALAGVAAIVLLWRRRGA